MSDFKKFNLITGWAAFAVAALVYILSMEPTASMWDCAEFIATSYKLEVGHPPGAPLFMMIARFFTIFAPGPGYAAWMVNLMSSLCGAFTVLFLCWTITHMGRKIYERNGAAMNTGQMWAVLGAGLIGSLAYCFTDTQWFSAVEGEVYSMSSMFTAMVFWAMLQWENVADEPRANRWLILIAYLMGLSIGIHILNLLTIPGLVFIYYFRKYPKVTKKGVILTTLIAGAILLVINSLIIPYTVAIGAFVDRLFVNTFNLPVNVGITVFVFVVFALCAWAIYYTHRKGKSLANTMMLCLTVILIGYGSYASVLIRAAANPPMNSNDPSNPYLLRSLLNRDQYGDKPLLYGPYYTSPASGEMIERTTYYLNDKGRYVKREIPSGSVYDDQYKYLFPRVYSRDQRHIEGYQDWGQITGRPTMIRGEVAMVPTFGENLRYFFSYQLNFMYWRYFLWNFVGRQSDEQSHGEITDGNWLSGINFIDQMYLGPQSDLPSDKANNKGRNRYYFLPFILGLIGLIYQLNRDKRNFAVTTWLFIMMGVALVVYFNTTPGEPRERDYVYAGSFYAFCIWIGLGLMWVYDKLAKITKKESVAIAAIATVVCAVVPVILIAQNWDDHDRSGRYTARDAGYNYLQSTLPGSIMICYGDNDTFPLWYNQEVEGTRLDVKIMNMSYLDADWYVDQMKLRSNEAAPVPFSLPRSKYMDPTNQIIPVDERFESATLKDVMSFIRNEDPRSKISYYGDMLDYFPTRTLILPVNKENAVKSGIVRPEDAHLMVDSITITIDQDYISRSKMMVLDMLANFDWNRPVYFTNGFSIGELGLQEYLQYDGYAYRLVPIHTPVDSSQIDIGRIDTEYLYDKLMNEFRWMGIKDPKVYCDPFTRYNIRSTYVRNGFARLAKALTAEGDNERAVEVLDYVEEELPCKQIGYDFYIVAPVIEAYYQAGEFTKGNELLTEYAGVLKEYADYYARFTGYKAELIDIDIRRNIYSIYNLQMLASSYGQDEQAKELDAFLRARI